MAKSIPTPNKNGSIQKPCNGPAVCESGSDNGSRLWPRAPWGKKAYSREQRFSAEGDFALQGARGNVL